jgi:hypothetical protein
LHRGGALRRHWHFFCQGWLKRDLVKEHDLLAKNLISKTKPQTHSSDQRNKATRQLYEGAKPTLERLATVSNRLIDELKDLSARENWLPVQEAIVMRRRLSVLSDRVLALMEEPDEDALLAKTRLDAITSLLKAIDRLKVVIADMSDEVAISHDETEITTAFAAIDQRIGELAEAYAKKLVEGQFEAGTN